MAKKYPKLQRMPTEESNAFVTIDYYPGYKLKLKSPPPQVHNPSKFQKITHIFETYSK